MWSVSCRQMVWVRKKEEKICFNLACFVQVWNN